MVASDNPRPQRTPEEVQNEIAEIRTELDDTLDKIGERLSPHHIKERVRDYAKDAAASATSAVERHPVPATVWGLIAITTLFVRHRTQRRAARQRARQILAIWKPLYAALETAAREAATAEAPRAGSAAGSIVSKVAALAADHGLSQRVGDVAARAQKAVSDSATSLAEPAKRVRALVEETSRDQPLLLVGSAALAGIMLGALLRR